ncbi:hypothetical protein DFH94DRAFT_27645 [Russula ochroleuca]|uniref:Uncharacterized protein n=1 Tax=Russula ochroleuca TaxID=152965 RepID=A0A9P5N794_9AGAM|nr:hypothetical protein DFH94DRAFT_27645 [Russula ochroleuca]
MVNFHDPATIAQDYLGVMKLWHFVDGLFIWEFVTTLDYELEVIRGKRPYRWTIWIYSMARVATLLAVILNMVGFDTTTEINCQVWVTFAVFFAYLAFSLSSLLIVLRVIAIWNRSKIIIAITMSVWLTDVALFLYGVILIRSTWSPAANTCVVNNFDITTPNVIGTLVTDTTLCIMMLVGLLRLRLEAGGNFALGTFLWKQGLIWFLLAALAEIPSSTLSFMNLNVSLNLMTQTPSMIIVTIAATRVYRSLTNFNCANSSLETPGGNGHSGSVPRVRPVPIPLNKMEVTVRTECDQYPTSQMNRSGTYIGTDTQGNYKAHEVSLNADVECGLEEK